MHDKYSKAYKHIKNITYIKYQQGYCQNGKLTAQIVFLLLCKVLSKLRRFKLRNISVTLFTTSIAKRALNIYANKCCPSKYTHIRSE